MPDAAFFLSHGAPTIALAPGEYGEALADAGAALPAPSGLLVFSAHFPSRGEVRLTSAARPPLVYDFSGFPDELYRKRYDAPGSPSLAEEARDLLRGSGVRASTDERRGWDHGLWIPLSLAFPEASVPVVEASLPVGASPEDLLGIGRALAPLAARGVLVVGSGGIVHNLGRVRFGAGAGAVEPWAHAFDEWVADRLAAGETDRLARYREEAPHADLAVPTPEHFDPLFVALGSAGDGYRAEPLYRGFEHGTISLSSYRFSAPRVEG
jgi:4,5-DOPA dioxygenase extradiol